LLQLEAAQARHMQVRYQAGRVMDGARIQEQFRGCERARFVSKRKKQLLEAASSPTVIVDDADHRDLKRFQLEMIRRNHNKLLAPCGRDANDVPA